MNPSPPHDLVSGAFIFFALGTALVMLGVAILLEALVLRLLKWASGWVCLADSVMANLASALLGCILVPVIGIGSNLLPASTLGQLDVVWPWVFWPAAFLLTWIVESWVVSIIRRRPFKDVLRPFLVINLASYGLFLAWFILGQ